MAREKWERSTFGGTHRPLSGNQNGHSQRELSERASFDNEGAPGCIFGLIMMIVVAVMGVIFSG